MPDPALLKAIGDAGGWVALAAAALLVVRAFQRGDIVPGSLLTRALDANDRQVEVLSTLGGAVKDLSNQTSATLTELRKDVDELRRSAGWSRAD